MLGPPILYINDLAANVKSYIKYFANDTMLYSIVSDPLLFAEELNRDLHIICKWTEQWKMSFNPETQTNKL